MKALGIKVGMKASGVLICISAFSLSFCNNETAGKAVKVNGKYENESTMLSLDLEQSGDCLGQVAKRTLFVPAAGGKRQYI